MSGAEKRIIGFYRIRRVLRLSARFSLPDFGEGRGGVSPRHGAGGHPFQNFSAAKRELDATSGVTGWRLHDLRRTCVSGMASLGIAPHVADKILNHQSGTISGVAAVYQRHQFLAERKAALEVWGAHVAQIVSGVLTERRSGLSLVA
jgi:integrase